MSNISISVMQKSDIDVLTGFFVDAFRDQFEPWTEETSKEHLLEIFNKDLTKV